MNKKQSAIRNPQSTIVLVHGAFRGGWSWQKVRRILQSRGHEVFSPSLTGAGEKVHLLTPEITLETWTNDIVNLLKSEDLSNVILVGHSQGGIVIQAAAEAVSERISQLVFIDAPVLEDGQCAIDALPKEMLEKFGETPRNALIPPMPLQQNEHFSNKECEWINQRLTPVPTNPSFEPIRIQKSASVPRSYVFCSQTPPFYPSNYTRQKFDNQGIDYKLIEAPHDCIWTHADLIANLLLQICISDL